MVTHPSKHSLSPCQSLSCSWRPRSGTLKLSRPRSRSVITKSRAAREAHSPCRPRRREPARRGRPDPSLRSGTSRFSGAPGSASDLPGRRLASQPRPHPAPQRGAASAPYRRVLAASRTEQTPCFCFQSETPPRGGARDSARRDPLASSMELEKSPCSQSPCPVSLSCLCSS